MDATEKPQVTMADALMALNATLQEARTTKTSDVDLARILAEVSQTMRAIQEKADSTATAQLDLIHRQMPENQSHPDISAYNPLGERDHPKPALKCPILWVGYPLTTATLTAQEIEGLNRLQPGTFWVTKATGDQLKLQIEAKRNAGGEVEELAVWFPCNGNDKHNHRSMLDYCLEATGTPVPQLADLQAELNRLKAELAQRQDREKQPAMVSA